MPNPSPKASCYSARRFFQYSKTSTIEGGTWQKLGPHVNAKLAYAKSISSPVDRAISIAWIFIRERHCCREAGTRNPTLVLIML